MRKLYTFFIALFAICGLVQAQVTFDFTGETAYEQFGLTGFSSGSGATAVTDGDITAEAGVTATSGDVTITVSPSGKSNPNRMWLGSLRLYGGTLTIASAGDNITAIKFVLNSSKWGADNAFDSGTYDAGTWTGDAASVVLTVAANTQIKSMEITLGESGGGTPDPDPTPDPTPSEGATGTGTLADPFNFIAANDCAGALAQGATTEKDYYIKGKVSEVKYSFDAQHGTATFFITDDGEKADNQFQVYSAYYLGNRSWQDGDTQIAVGDEVVIYGKLTNYNGTLETAAKKSYIYSLNGETGEAVVIPEYTSIEAMQTAAQALGTTKADVKYTFQNVVVTYVNSKNIYVKDASRGFLLFGTNSKNLKAGDILSGFISGKLQLYSGLTELAVDNFDNVTVTEGEAPAPEAVSGVGGIISENTRLQYENKLVTIEGVTIGTNEEGTQFFIVDASSNQLPLYFKNANDFKDMVLDLDETYNVTGIVGYHDGVQLAPRSTDDFVKVGEANLETPVSGWDVVNVVVAMGGTVTAHFTTNSDATVTYGSDDPEVATISPNGIITLVGPGTTTIFAETEATATFKSDYKEFTLTVTSGADGTLENPFSVADMLSFVTESTKVNIFENVWVEGFVVGYINGSTLNENTAVFSAEAPEDKTVPVSNVLIAASTTANDVEAVVPVALKANTSARADINLADNPAMLGQKVWLKGNVTKYMGVTGLKEVAAYSIDGEEVVDGVRIINADAVTNGEIYNIAGQRVSTMTKAGIYVVGGHKVVVK